MVSRKVVEKLMSRQIRAVNLGDCSPDGLLVCDDDGSTFMECDQGGLISFGSLAAGTICEDGMIVSAEE